MTRTIGPLVLAMASMLAGCEGGQGKATFDDPQKHGEFVYMRWCAGCHGPTGQGGGARARGAKRPPPDLRTGQWSDDHLRRVIREGIQGTIMPPMPVPDSDLEALIAHVQRLSES
jgi:mono/diheme cytochrome c family protein